MYSKTTWKDRVVDPDTGAVVQEGTFMSAEHFNNMENGIAANDSAISTINGDIDDIEETLDTGVGTTISLTINQSTFVMKLALKNSEGTTLSEQSIDLPIESMVVNAEYVEATKSLVLTLQSASKVTVPLSALINGLVNDTRKVAGIDLKDDITVAEMKTALGVDVLERNKVDKATVSNVSSTTSVNTVPECLGYAGVKMIGGKTVKNLFNGYTNLKNYTISDSTYEGCQIIETTTAYNGATDENLVLKAHKTYRVRAMIKSSAENAGIATWFMINGVAKSSGWLNISSANTWIEYNFAITVEYDTDATNVRIESNTACNTQITQFTVTEGEEYYGYLPTGLTSAPVERIVSKGKNLVNVSEIKSGNISNFTVSSNADILTVNHLNSSTSGTPSIKISESGTYAFSYELISGTVTFSYFIGSTWVKDLTNNSILEIPSNSEASIYISPSANTTAKMRLQLEKSSTATAYSPYFETELSIPDAIKNLPDYGVGIGDVYNYIDFERGVYVQNIYKVSVSDLTITHAMGTDRYFATWLKSGMPNIKNVSDSGVVVPVIHAKYEAYSQNTFFRGDVDNTIAYYWTGHNTSHFDTQAFVYKDMSCVKDTQNESINAFKAKNEGQYIYYQRETPLEIPLSSILAPIPCETGGTITLVNEHSLDVPNTIVYKTSI